MTARGIAGVGPHLGRGALKKNPTAEFQDQPGRILAAALGLVILLMPTYTDEPPKNQVRLFQIRPFVDHVAGAGVSEGTGTAFLDPLS